MSPEQQYKRKIHLETKYGIPAIINSLLKGN